MNILTKAKSESRDVLIDETDLETEVNRNETIVKKASNYQQTRSPWIHSITLDCHAR
ncbi:MAG: hypothetical protein LBS71_02070 [Puniceicoccales bacterium]|jgi:hypothetical protein|nr:hypothetical protein [Puniceicoccales bacterium]